MSARCNDGVEQVLNRNIVPHDLALCAIDLTVLLPNLLLDVGQLVLQRLQDLLGDVLLLLEPRLAFDLLLFPVLVFLAHAVDIVCYEVDTLAERIRALAEDLDGFLHEFNVVLREALTHL